MGKKRDEEFEAVVLGSAISVGWQQETAGDFHVLHNYSSTVTYIYKDKWRERERD